MNKANFLKNLVASIGAQGIVVIFNFISIPFLLTRVGVEAFGLIAFYSSLQAVFAILDSGMSPLLVRETASNIQGSNHEKRQYSALLDALKFFFIFIAIFGFGLIFFNASFIVDSLINTNEIDTLEVVIIIKVMAFIIGLRWLSGFYRALFIGHQNIHILSLISIFIAALKFLIVLIYLYFIDGGIIDFFHYQAFCAVVEILLLYLISARVNKYFRYKTSLSDKLFSLKSKYKYAVHAGVASIIWIILTQADKFLIIRLLDLEYFAIFSIGVLGASIFFFISNPLSSALIPRLTEINKYQSLEKFKKFYVLNLNLFSILLISSAMFIYMFSEELLFIWTGDEALSEKASFILGNYALGNCLAVLSSFAYFLQASKGNLSLHLYGSAAFLVLFLPTLLICVNNFGMNGAAMAWLSCNVIMFSFWGAYIHNIYLKGFYRNWLIKKLIPILLISFLLVQIEHLIFTSYILYLPVAIFSVFCCILNLGVIYSIFFGFNLQPLNSLRSSS